MVVGNQVFQRDGDRLVAAAGLGATEHGQAPDGELSWQRSTALLWPT
jgi:hypothetical protein